ncbi:MAG: hypothetical protein WC299_03315 [Kiritimatiellia bacterium]
MKMKIIVLLAVMGLSTAASADETNLPFQVLDQWKGKPVEEMTKALGSPTTVLSYTIGRAATKNWNHSILFSVYPREKPENKDVPIREFVWDQGKNEIRACCHMTNGNWFVLGAMKLDKGVRF